MDVIIFPNDEGGVSLIIPTGEIAIEQVALKDVPADKPFRFVKRSDLPDFYFFDAWEADFSQPDGYGIGHDAWVAQQENN